MKNSTACFIFLGIVLVLAATGGHGKSTVAQSSGSSVVSQIDSVFGAYSSQAEAIAMCESSDNPSAVNTTTAVMINGHAEYAQGLFQIIPSTWSTTSYRYQSPLDLNANTHAAFEIFSRDGYTWRSGLASHRRRTQ